MSHSIIRVQKMKSTALKGIQFHNQREKESQTNPDIRTEDAYLNYDLIHGDKKLDYKKEIQQVISENVKSEKKIRKDAVLLSEFLITSDSSFFANLTPDEQKRYFETAKDFIADKYGEQNIIYATVHNDEKTPHMHVGLVPVTDDGRLSAKDVFGNRMQFVKLQDDFNAHVKAHGFDLERGVSSGRKHLDMAKFKAMTAYEAEKEATQRYEQTISQIQAIDEKTMAIEDGKPKKVLGYTLMKNDEYKALVAHAINSAVLEAETTELKHHLTQSDKELQEMKQTIQRDQDKLRKNYRGIELRSQEIQENLEKLADEKADEMVIKKLEKHQVLQKYTQLSDAYQKLAGDYQGAEKKVLELEFDRKSYLRENAVLKAEESSRKKEVDSLQKENDSLREQIIGLKNDFEAWKVRMVDALNRQFARIRTLLNVKNAEPALLKSLDEKKDKIVLDSLKEMEKPKEQAKTKEMELE